MAPSSAGPQPLPPAFTSSWDLSSAAPPPPPGHGPSPSSFLSFSILPPLHAPASAAADAAYFAAAAAGSAAGLGKAAGGAGGWRWDQRQREVRRAYAEWAPVGKDAEWEAQNRERGYRLEDLQRLLDANFISMFLILATQLILENLLKML